MNIRKPYTITESEKNRIRGLHTNLKNVINEYYDDRTWEDQIKDLSKGIPTPDNPFGGTSSEGGSEEDLEKGDRRYVEMGEEMLTDLNGGTYEVAEERGKVDSVIFEPTAGPPGLGGGVPGTPGGGTPASTNPGGNLPKGWTMKTPEELQEEAGMDDIYEIWSGQEDTDSLRESMRDTGTSGEMVYELPRRFGKKRLTESQLISMINTIIK